MLISKVNYISLKAYISALFLGFEPMTLAVLVLRSLFMSVEKSSMAIAIHIAESRFYYILLHYLIVYIVIVLLNMARVIIKNSIIINIVIISILNF